MTQKSHGQDGPPDQAAKEEAALFAALLARVRASQDKSHLLERSEAALRLILDRGEDEALRDEMISLVTNAVSLVPDNIEGERGRVALATAISDCLRFLASAEQRRVEWMSAARTGQPPGPAMPLSPDPAAGAAARHARPLESVADFEKSVNAKRRARRGVRSSGRGGTAAMILTLLIILGAGLAISLNSRQDARQNADQSRPLVVQIEAAVHGQVPVTNLFGGTIRVSIENGRTTVTLTGIPAGECVLSGWELVRKGILTINGVTPIRVSAAKLNDLCHDDDTATLRWTPKETAQ